MVPTTGPDLLTRHIRRLRAAPLIGLSDAELLRLFGRGAPEGGAAFEVIVRRHGPMVLRACRAAMGDAHAADDCFQAVFLVLVRKGRGLRLRGPLGPWLFEVARRVCARANVSAARRLRHEARAAKTDVSDTIDGLSNDVAALVHAEVGRLPRGLRAAVVLCDLAGLTYQEGADRLGVSRPTFRGRLARGRDRLRRRLEQRGLSPDGIWAAAVVVPVALAGATADAAEVLAGRATGAVSAVVLELVRGGMQSMVMTKLKAVGLSALTAGVLVAGALGVGAQSSTPPPTQPPRADYGPRGIGSVSALTGVAEAAPDERDPGDDVAALVRRAQRQQDRGDAAGARKTVRQVDAALKRWAARLDDTARSAPAAVVPGYGIGGRPPGAPAGMGAAPIGAAGGAAGGVPGAAPPGGFGGRGMAPAAGPTPPADMESRLRELEGKLDRLLKQIDHQKTEPAKNLRP